MVATAPIDQAMVRVDVEVSDETRIAAEAAAIAASKPVSELMQDLLVDHLVKSGHLHKAVGLN